MGSTSGAGARLWGTVYAHRAEVLYELGASEASARDAQSTLECERLTRLQVRDCPYDHNQSSYRSALHDVFSVPGRCARWARAEGVGDAFQDSIDVAKRALEDAEDLLAGERKKSTVEWAVRSARASTNNAAVGLPYLGKYEGPEKKLEMGRCKSMDYLTVLDEARRSRPCPLPCTSVK